MNLIDLLRSNNIEGLLPSEFIEVLSYTHPSIRIRNDANGAIVLSNRVVVKCVKEYYVNPSKEAKKPVGVNICHTVHKNFDIIGVGANHCSACHLNCLSKKEDGKLTMVLKKPSPKRRR